MEQCYYCHDKDPGRLILSTRVVNGKVVTVDICPRCFWLDQFRAEGEDGNALREGREREVSARSLNSFGLQERINTAREG
jgi:hypothetical protein